MDSLQITVACLGVVGYALLLFLNRDTYSKHFTLTESTGRAVKPFNNQLHILTSGTSRHTFAIPKNYQYRSEEKMVRTARELTSAQFVLHYDVDLFTREDPVIWNPRFLTNAAHPEKEPESLWFEKCDASDERGYSCKATYCDGEILIDVTAPEPCGCSIQLEYGYPFERKTLFGSCTDYAMGMLLWIL